MPKTIKEKRKKRRPKVPIFDLPGKGNIDPRLIRQAIVEVRDRRIKEEAEGKAQSLLESSGTHSEESK